MTQGQQHNSVKPTRSKLGKLAFLSPALQFPISYLWVWKENDKWMPSLWNTARRWESGVGGSLCHVCTYSQQKESDCCWDCSVLLHGCVKTIPGLQTTFRYFALELQITVGTVHCLPSLHCKATDRFPRILSFISIYKKKILHPEWWFTKLIVL